MTSRSLMEKIRAEHIDSFRPDIMRLRQEILDSMDATDEKGEYVECLGWGLWVVFPTVFRPWQDSISLVENYQIRKGENVLDMCTGAGNIAVDAAYKGAKKVVAVDINPFAVKAATINAYLHGVADKVEARVSDVFSGIASEAGFDVIIGNFPFTHHTVNSMTEAGVYSSANMGVSDKFFYHVEARLNPKGRIYLAQANFGDCLDMLELADRNRFNARLIGENQLENDPRKFYAFEFRRKVK